MKAQKGAVDLTVGPISWSSMLTARGQPGGQRAFISSISLWRYVHQDQNDHDEAQHEAKNSPLVLRVKGLEHLPPVSVPFRVFLSRLACWAKAQRRSLGAKIPRKSPAHRCFAVSAEQIWAETRRSPQRILPYCQGLERSISPNLPAQTGRGSSPFTLSPTPLRREVANRLSTARLSPGLPGGLLKRLASFYTLRCVLSIHTVSGVYVQWCVFAGDLRRGWISPPGRRGPVAGPPLTTDH